MSSSGTKVGNSDLDSQFIDIFRAKLAKYVGTDAVHKTFTFVFEIEVKRIPKQDEG